jgi:hypothetical protein
VKIPKHGHIATCIQYSYSGYVNVKEKLPTDINTPQDKLMHTSTYQDTNLHPDFVAIRAMSRIIHLVTQMLTMQEKRL